MPTSYEPPAPRRICSVCDKSKTIAEIGRISAGKKPVCRACKAQANADYQRRRRTENPALVRSMNLWRMYKITEREYDDLRAKQEYRCAICLTHEDDIDVSGYGGRPRKDGSMNTRFALCVDHCHDRDAIRGLLCMPCNQALGQMRDDPKRLRQAAAYVERTPLIMIDRARTRVRSSANQGLLWEEPA